MAPAAPIRPGAETNPRPSFVGSALPGAPVKKTAGRGNSPLVFGRDTSGKF